MYHSGNMPWKRDLDGSSMDFIFTLRFGEDHAYARKIKNQSEEMLVSLISPDLKGPLVAILHELSVNGFKAIQKKKFIETRKERGLSCEGAEFSGPFREYMEKSAANPGLEEIEVTVSGSTDREAFVLSVRNRGEATEDELQRIHRAFDRIRKGHDPGSLLEEEGLDSILEGGGIGIPMILFNLKGLGLPLESLSFRVESGSTVVRLALPWRFFRKPPVHRIEIYSMRDPVVGPGLSPLFENLGIGLVDFGPSGELLAISENLLVDHGISLSEPRKFLELLPPRFFGEALSGSFGLLQNGRLENYRTYLKTDGSDGEPFYNISGSEAGEKRFRTIWQPVTPLKTGKRLKPGNLLEKIRLHDLLEPYIPTPVLWKARELLHGEESDLPNEIADLTVFFADLEGFTRIAEFMDPALVVDFLNIALGVCVRTIEERGGMIDKFIGDAVMGIFRDPLNAIVAAMEIQHQYYQLNEFRTLSGEPRVKVRIGIHSGAVIVGNVGTRNRRDWTPVGDVVNTASRIERSGKSGSVLIGAPTYEAVKQNVRVIPGGEVSMKGKEERVPVYSVIEVHFEKEGQHYTLRRDSLEEESQA